MKVDASIRDINKTVSKEIDARNKQKKVEEPTQQNLPQIPL